MFKFLKDKLKGAVKKFTKKVEDEGEETQIEEPVQEKVEKKETKKPVKEKKEQPKKEKKPAPKKEEVSKPVKEVKEEKEKKEVPKETVVEEAPKKEIVEEQKEEVKEEPIKEKEVPKEEIVEPEVEKEPEPQEAPKEKVGFFQKLTAKKITESTFEELFFDLEIILLENNVAVEVIEKIKQDIKTQLVDQAVKRSKVQDIVETTLKNSIQEILESAEPKEDLFAKKESPLVIAFFGMNGSGKTTTIAKLTHKLLKEKKSVVLAAADTFRAAAIHQLEEHANKLNVKIIKHDYGSDPAAVGFDAIEHAKAQNIDVVLIDTAGRMHANANLMEEMKKIVRITNPHIKIFVGESITGNDCIEQAVKFDEAVQLDGIMLAKADVDEKGGTALSVSYVTKKPIFFLGTGQEYDDLEAFDVKTMLSRLGM